MALGAKIQNGHGQFLLTSSISPESQIPSSPFLLLSDCFSVLTSGFHQNWKEAYVYQKYITKV